MNFIGLFICIEIRIHSERNHVHGNKYNIYGIFYANNTFEVEIRKVSDHVFVCYGFRLSLFLRF